MVFLVDSDFVYAADSVFEDVVGFFNSILFSRVGLLPLLSPQKPLLAPSGYRAYPLGGGEEGPSGGGSGGPGGFISNCVWFYGYGGGVCTDDLGGAVSNGKVAINNDNLGHSNEYLCGNQNLWCVIDAGGPADNQQDQGFRYCGNGQCESQNGENTDNCPLEDCQGEPQQCGNTDISCGIYPNCSNCNNNDCELSDGYACEYFDNEQNKIHEIGSDYGCLGNENGCGLIGEKHCNPGGAPGYWYCSLYYECQQRNCGDDLPNTFTCFKDPNGGQWKWGGEPGNILGVELPTSEENCNDGYDNDCDGLVDMDDDDCAEPVETSCDDNVDNDGDGYIDCQDSDCADTKPDPLGNCDTVVCNQENFDWEHTQDNNLCSGDCAVCGSDYNCEAQPEPVCGACGVCEGSGTTFNCVALDNGQSDLECNGFCCAGNCLNPGFDYGDSCGQAGTECSGGTIVCDGGNYKCSTMGDECAYCDGDSGVSGICNRDGDCENLNQNDCAACMQCVDNGLSVSCEPYPENSEDQTSPNLCQSPYYCNGQGNCLLTEEVCNNGIDDDQNGLIDCEDPVCAGQQGPNGQWCCSSVDDCVNDPNYDELCNIPSCVDNVCTYPLIDDNTQDSLGNEKCEGFCQACQNGECGYANLGTDPGNDCPSAACDADSCNGQGQCQDFTGDDGYLCADDCTKCENGQCVNRAACDSTECADGLYCSGNGGSCEDPDVNNQLGETLCETCISGGQHNFEEDWQFEQTTDPYCCQNDMNENYIVTGQNSACCDNPNDCVDANGICREGVETSDAQCSDGVDNDCDGLIDCEDSDCSSYCQEICDNGIDDDQNGLVDCEDPGCPSPAPFGECDNVVCNPQTYQWEHTLDESVCGVCEYCSDVTYNCEFVDDGGQDSDTCFGDSYCDGMGNCRECIEPIGGEEITQNSFICPGTYYLSQPITITGFNTFVKLNCLNSLLIGANYGTGIVVTGSYLDIAIIKNCSFHNFDKAIETLGSKTLKLYNNRFDGVNIGAKMNYAGSGTRFVSNRIDSAGTGFWILNGGGALFEDNTIAGAYYGILLGDVASVQFINNSINTNHYGIYLEEPVYLEMNGDFICYNDYVGQGYDLYCAAGGGAHGYDYQLERSNCNYLYGNQPCSQPLQQGGFFNSILNFFRNLF
jgi:hypothetical protein